jgi:hypothetical protein
MFSFENCSFGSLTYQQAANELSDTWPAKDAFRLISCDSNVKQPSIIERVNKSQDVDLCLRTITHLPAVSMLILSVFANPQINVSLLLERLP